MVSMLTGVIVYCLYINIDIFSGTRAWASGFVRVIQPTLLFMMLLLTFLKIKPSDLRLRRWHFIGLALQGVFWILGSVLLAFMPMSQLCRFGIEGFILCMICPTATAAAVITGKLGGNQSSLTMYIILANLLASFLIPCMLPLIHGEHDLSFWSTFFIIASKIFPLLFLPFVCAILMRRVMPNMVRSLLGIPNAAFYLWMTALSIAIAVSVKNMHRSLNAGDGIMPQIVIAVASLLACIIQFSFGKWMGRHVSNYAEDEIISSTQGLGQKNTIFSIWCGYTFMDPLSSIAGGFYSIWHNVYNSYQLSKRRAKS